MCLWGLLDVHFLQHSEAMEELNGKCEAPSRSALHSATTLAIQF